MRNWFYLQDTSTQCTDHINNQVAMFLNCCKFLTYNLLKNRVEQIIQSSKKSQRLTILRETSQFYRFQK